MSRSQKKQRTYNRSKSFFDACFSILAIALVTLFAWRLISEGLHKTNNAAFFFFPLNLVKLTPASDYFELFTEPYESEEWWIWIEVAVSVSVWLLIYASVRAAYYSFITMSKFALWLFVVMMSMIIFFYFMILQPVFEEANSWWEESPVEGYEHPDE